MIRRAPLDADAERADLARLGSVGVDPAAGVAVAAGGFDTVSGAGRDERRLQRTDERAEQQLAIGETDDGIRDQLAGAVVRDLAAALDAEDLDTACGELGRCREDVRLVRLASEREDRGVLEEEELVGDRAARAGGRQPFLQIPGISVRDAPQPVRLERGALLCGARSRGCLPTHHARDDSRHPFPTPSGACHGRATDVRA